MNNSSEQRISLSACWQNVLNDETEALSIIHKTLYPDLFHYANNLLKDEELAEDSIQELFIKVWTKRAKIGELTYVKAYLFTALRRDILNRLRNLHLRSLKITGTEEADIEFSPEDIIIASEDDTRRKQQIGKLLNALPKRQKEVIYLKYFDDLDYDEIAQIMGINYQSVVNLSFKAIRFLRVQLSKEGPKIFTIFLNKKSI